MRMVVIDFETYFENGAYTLSKMSTESYIRDPRFEAHGAAIKWSASTSPQWYSGERLRYILANEDWSDTFLVAHHAQFDGLILSHHYGVVPKMYGCTLAMARLLLGNHLSVSLDSVRKHFGMPLKITPYNLFINKHWKDIDEATQTLVADGAIDEVESIWKLFTEKLAPAFPVEEFDVVDMVIRMFTQPVMQGDLNMLADLWQREEVKKSSILRDLGFDVSTEAGRAFAESELQSSERFAALLRAEGEEPETKTTAKGNEVFAFAKTDPYMRDVLLEHDNDRVRALAEARLGVKSTLLQTRAETYGFMARRGPLPVYLNYAGAGTLRVSGGDKANWLNLKRRSPIRRSLLAPEGYWLAPVDSSQIECRVLHYLAGGPDEPVIKLFREKADPYAGLASKFYGEPIYKPKDNDPRKEEMEAKRGMGKQGRLMCGYGSSGRMFQQSAKNGLYGPSLIIPIEVADEFVQVYRTDNPSICAPRVGYWAQSGKMLARLAGGDPIDWGPLHIADHRIYVGPGRLPMIYDTLEYYKPEPHERHEYKEFEQDGFWRMKTKHGWKTMWGAKLTQNICEGVSRVIVSQAMTRIKHKYGIRTLNWPYDELLLLIPKGPNAEKLLEACLDEMRMTPDWLPGLPLDAEGALGDRYEK